MSTWSARRFWTDVTVQPQPGGYGVFLDTRPLRTPARAALIVPTRALADLVAAEWAAQSETIRPDTMPATRTVNVALDKLPATRPDVVTEIARWGETDLLCYRAEGPQALVERQRAAWDPLLDWAAARFAARLTVTAGIMPAAQPAAALVSLRAHLDSLGNLELCALHDLVALSGSLVIGLATAEGFAPDSDLWACSRIDEDWQIEQWGQDDEALALSEARRAGFLAAARIYAACRMVGH